MAARILWIAFLTAFTTQASTLRTARAREGSPYEVPGPDEDEDLAEQETVLEEDWGAGAYDPYADAQDAIFGDYSYRA